jgi:Zn finger protein HypA/HybF involved in hydrogenase expression
MDKVLKEYLQGVDNSGPCRRIQVHFKRFKKQIIGLDGRIYALKTLKTTCHCETPELVIDTLFNDPKNRAILKCDSCKSIFRDIKTGEPFVVQNPYK